MIDEPTSDQIETLRDNYERGAIDVVTFQNAEDDIYRGEQNSYAQASYDVNADGGQPEWPPDETALDQGLTRATFIVVVVLLALGVAGLGLVGWSVL